MGPTLPRLRRYVTPSAGQHPESRVAVVAGTACAPRVQIRHRELAGTGTCFKERWVARRTPVPNSVNPVGKSGRWVITGSLGCRTRGVGAPRERDVRHELRRLGTRGWHRFVAAVAGSRRKRHRAMAHAARLPVVHGLHGDGGVAVLEDAPVTAFTGKPLDVRGVGEGGIEHRRGPRQLEVKPESVQRRRWLLAGQTPPRVDNALAQRTDPIDVPSRIPRQEAQHLTGIECQLGRRAYGIGRKCRLDTRRSGWL